MNNSRRTLNSKYDIDPFVHQRLSNIASGKPNSKTFLPHRWAEVPCQVRTDPLNTAIINE
ncbi:MAG: hypothetical protein R2818_12245 [Flavobacteriales bacterium]